MLANNYAISRDCFHCALPMPAGCELSVAIEDEQHPVCCPGCKAVAELIRDSGMSNYYALRDTPQPGIGRPPDDETEWAAFNSDAMQQAFADVAGTVAEATVYAGGMYCSACSWLIDSTLNGMEGVRSADVNPMTHRVQVTWDTQTVGLGDVLARLAALGYQPQPLAPDDVAKPEVAEQRAALKRLLVASLGMMQVMMFAVGLYAGEFQGIDDDMQRFLRLVSFLKKGCAA
ncbi:MAG: heavy metal translocating P-type ATPase metal-binding domain-containing protein [Pseudomonadota bacterium]